MTIAFDAKRLFYNSTGLGQYARDLVRNLMKYCPDHNYRLLAHHTKSSVYDEEFLSLLKVSKSYPLFWRSFGIYRDIAEKEVDVYHGLSNELPFSINSALVPSVVTIHDVIFKRFPQWYPALDRMVYHQKTKFACQHADKIIAISEQTRQDIEEFYKVDSDKIHVIYQDCSESFSQEIMPEFHARVKTEYRLPEAYILTVGRLETRKNLMKVAESLKLLQEDIHWVCIGRDHGVKKDLVDYLKKNNLLHRVQFMENIPQMDLVSIYRQAIALVYLSLYEGFGIPILEGMRAGVSVITASRTSLIEVAGPNGLFIQNDDPEQIAQYVHRLFDSSSFVMDVLEHQKTQSQKFSKKKMAEETMAVYQSLIKR